VDLDEHWFLQHLVDQSHTKGIGIGPVGENGITRVAIDELLHERQKGHAIKEAIERVSSSGDSHVWRIPHLDTVDEVPVRYRGRQSRSPGDRRDDANIEVIAKLKHGLFDEDPFRRLLVVRKEGRHHQEPSQAEMAVQRRGNDIRSRHCATSSSWRGMKLFFRSGRG
jgi:hypothetical protein